MWSKEVISRNWYILSSSLCVESMPLFNHQSPFWDFPYTLSYTLILFYQLLFGQVHVCDVGVQAFWNALYFPVISVGGWEDVRGL